MILFVENDDSFSWNVLETLPFPREAVRVVRASEAIASLTGDIEQVVVGPGPMDPERAGLIPFVHEVARRGLPYLGVCLGHQALGLAFGASLFRSTPTHGKRAFANFLPSRRFGHVTGRVEVMRYHSLSLRGVKPPLQVTATLEDGTVMAVEHESLPMVGVQFHPDSFGTPRGRELMRNSLSLQSGERAGERGQSDSAPEKCKLSEIAKREEFALLAPAFTGTQDWSLLDLESEEPNATLWHAKAEGQSVAARGELKSVALELDVQGGGLHPQLDDRDYLEDVERIRESIAAGDVYQVNLTLRAKLLGARDGAHLLSTFSRRGAPRFGAWVRSRVLGEFVSASPELLVSRDGRTVRVEPMKGTAAPDQRAWLEASEKDRAELAMITDLLRDDLHHLCERGSVIVENERRFIELPYALQTVADVSGTLREDVTTRALLQQVHPGGSVTGAPRNAACAIISKLEKTPRGAYCGLLGLEVDGRGVRENTLITSLLIRTAERQPDGWVYGVGGGITWDSDPNAELEEVRLKLGALR